MMRKKSKNKIGRKLFDGKSEKETLQKLKGAYMIGANDKEACIKASISPSALYEYQKKNPEFLEQKEMFKLNPILKAKQTIFDNLDKIEVAKWYLERKGKIEFNTVLFPSELDNNEDEARKAMEKYHEKLAELLAIEQDSNKTK